MITIPENRKRQNDNYKIKKQNELTKLKVIRNK